MPKKERKITRKELLTKISPNHLKLIEDNVFCVNCGNTAIVDYNESILVNDLDDTILKGKCGQCDAVVARYLETGER